MILHDQHLHSKYSHDSNEELINYIEIANRMGCKYFVTTEHFDLDLVINHEDWIVDYQALKNELQIHQKNYPNICFLLGIEVGYRKDKLLEITKQLNSEDFDVINLSIHDSKEEDFYWYKYFLSVGEKELLNKYFDIMIEATSNFDKYNVLSHIDYGFKTVYLVNNKIKISDFEEKIKKVFMNLIKHHKALEINTKVQEAIHDINHTKYLLSLYRQIGGEKLTLSSDAHSKERYLSNFDYYKKIIKECGFHYLVYFVKQKEYHYSI